MEYLLGSIITLVTMFVVSRMVIPKVIKPLQMNLKYSQSHAYDIVKDFLPLTQKPKQIKKTQSRKFFQLSSTRILFINNNAYWIKDNTLFTADFIDGKIDEESTKKVDTYDMDKVELDKTIFIVEKLTEGLTDDSGNSGK